MTERIKRTERFKANYVEDDKKAALRNKRKEENKTAAEAFLAGMIAFIALSAAAFSPK